MTDDEYDALEATVNNGEPIMAYQATDAIRYIRDRGIERYHGMTKDAWIEQVLEFLEAAGLD